MSPISVVRDSQIKAALTDVSTDIITVTSELNDVSIDVTTVTNYSSSINSSAIFKKNVSHPLISTIVKGVEFDETISISNEIVEQFDTYTFKFNKPGIYKIDYHVTAYIHEDNGIQDLLIRPSVSDTLTGTGEFLNFSDFGIITTRKKVQTSSHVDKASPHAVDSIYDSCVYRYDGNGDIYFKLLAWGPNTPESYIEAGATLIFTYLSS